MKTPREILLGRHQAAEPKLDAIRREVVAETVAAVCDRREIDRGGRVGAHRAPLQANRLGTIAGKLWRELILSLRWHVAAMSAVWLVAALLSIDHSPGPAVKAANQNVASPNQVLVALRENRRQLSELIQTPAAELIPVPRTFVPRRRSELQSPTEMA